MPRYQPRYKLIRHEKNFNDKEFRKDCSELLLSILYGLESSDDMVKTLNTILVECIDRYAPVRRVKVTRPPTPWMQTREIQELQIERDTLRAVAHATNTAKSWNAFRHVRNHIKSVIIKSKLRFIANSLSSKRPKKVWSNSSDTQP